MIKEIKYMKEIGKKVLKMEMAKHILKMESYIMKENGKKVYQMEKV